MRCRSLFTVQATKAKLLKIFAIVLFQNVIPVHWIMYCLIPKILSLDINEVLSGSVSHLVVMHCLECLHSHQGHY